MRTKHAILNFLVGGGGEILSLLIGFATRIAFIRTLGIEYVGVSGLFSSILTMLSMAELGIGSSIVFSLYRPLAEKDQLQIRALMQLYKKVCTIIGTVVLVVGTALIPFLPQLIKDPGTIPNLPLIYFLFVVDSASSYFFAYNRSLCEADQQQYKIAGADYSLKTVGSVTNMGLMFLFHNYILYLLIQISFNLFRNVLVFWRVGKMYPYLAEKGKISIEVETRVVLLKNTVALFLYRVASAVIGGTDNILLSRFEGLTITGQYANYTLVIGGVSAILEKGILSIAGSVGNLSVKEDTAHQYQVFLRLQMFVSWIYGFAATGLLCLLNMFVSVFFGRENVLPWPVLVVVVFNFYILGSQYSITVFRNAYGLYWPGKWRPLIQCILNVAFSIAFYVYTQNMIGIFVGTSLSRLLTLWWYDPLLIYRKCFSKSVGSYFVQYLKYAGATVMPIVLSLFTLQIYNCSGPVMLLWGSVVCTLAYNGTFVLCFRKDASFNYYMQLLVRIMKKITGKL